MRETDSPNFDTKKKCINIKYSGDNSDTKLSVQCHINRGGGDSLTDVLLV